MTRFDLYSNFSVNIEIERNRLGLTQQKMADALGISLSKYKILITNPMESNVDIYLAHQIYRVTGKTARELSGDILPEFEMLKEFRKLPPHRQEAIRYVIETEADLLRDGCECQNTQNSDESEDNSAARSLSYSASENNICNKDCSTCTDYTTCYIPTGNMEDGMLLDSRNLKTVNISDFKHRTRERIDYAVLITSNHLHPVYLKGDYLLMSKRAPRDGDVGIFIEKSTRRMYIREFKQTNPCELRPINDYGDIIYVDSNSPKDMDKWIKFGTVLTCMR